jgi:hypothetical protein
LFFIAKLQLAKFLIPVLLFKRKKSVVYGHITVKTPDLVRSPKISTVELS